MSDHKHYLKVEMSVETADHDTMACHACGMLIKAHDKLTRGSVESCMAPDQPRAAVWCFACFRKIAEAVGR